MEADACVVPGGDAFGAHTRRHIEKLIELHEVIAQSAGDRRAPVQILVNEGAHHLGLEALLEIDDIVRNAEVLGYEASIVDIVERAAAAGDAAFRRKLRQPALI